MLSCRLEYEALTQNIRRNPVNRIRRVVVEPDHELGVRVRELNAVDPSFDRDTLALIVKVHMAVMRERGGHGHNQIESRSKNPKDSFHGSHRVSSTRYWIVTGLIARGWRLLPGPARQT